MSTAIDQLYPFLRALLGDRQVSGCWHYAADDLLSAVRSVFAFGRGPAGYALDGTVYVATAIAPEVAAGDPLALICYEAALILIGGEDGKKSIRTRELTLTDGGDRKADLLDLLRQKIYEVRDGGAVFASWQNFSQFLSAGGNDGLDWREFTDCRLVTTPPGVSL